MDLHITSRTKHTRHSGPPHCIVSGFDVTVCRGSAEPGRANNERASMLIESVTSCKQPRSGFIVFFLFVCLFSSNGLLVCSGPALQSLNFISRTVGAYTEERVRGSWGSV